MTVDMEIEDPRVLEMRRLLLRWLSHTHRELSQLVKWLQGEDLPTVDVDEEPYQSLLEGLPLADERYNAETELAIRAADLVDEKPDVRSIGNDPTKFLYNLLMLCAQLSSPTQLAEPLWAMFERRKLSGSYQGIDLRHVLESALIANQRDNRLEGVWCEMLCRRKHEFLTGDEYAGFEGVRLMPTSEGTRGEPALDDIGGAFVAIASTLEDRHDRRVHFNNLINRIIRTYPGRPTWNDDLARQAHKNRWPKWAVLCLPELFIPLVPSGDLKISLIWEVLVIILESGHAEYSVQEWLCPYSEMNDGLIARVSLSDDAFRFLSFVAPRVEKYRLTLKLNTYKAVSGSVIEALSILEEESRLGNGSNGLYGAEIFRTARENLRIRLGVMSIGVGSSGRTR